MPRLIVSLIFCILASSAASAQTAPLEDVQANAVISDTAATTGTTGASKAAVNNDAASNDTANEESAAADTVDEDLAEQDMAEQDMAEKVELPLRRPEPPKNIPPPKLAPANDLFGAVPTPAPLAARSIGGFAKGCLAGGVSLPINGPDWQVMRLSRNRNWGTPQLIDYMERLASDAHALDGWPGLLVGDLSQPRGGPMLTGHTSHQIGLDADIWLTPMPDRLLSPQEREEMTAISMLKDPFTVDPEIFTELQVKLIARAASYGQVGRIFVHPAIKKALCERADVAGEDKTWLRKVRPWWNHHYHFHVRLKCPRGMKGCKDQNPVGSELGCDAKAFTHWDKVLKDSAIWMSENKINPLAPILNRPSPSDRKNRGKLSDLPKECLNVLTAGGVTPMKVGDELPKSAVMAATSKDAGPGVPVLSSDELATLRGGGKLSMQMPVRNPIR